jgi:hypothetical protein
LPLSADAILMIRFYWKNCWRANKPLMRLTYPFKYSAQRC